MKPGTSGLKSLRIYACLRIAGGGFSSVCQTMAGAQVIPAECCRMEATLGIEVGKSALCRLAPRGGFL